MIAMRSLADVAEPENWKENAEPNSDSTPMRVAAACSKVKSRGRGSKPGQRCSAKGCQKRLKPWELVSGRCRCGGTFCARHIHFAAHVCTFNFNDQDDDQKKRDMAVLASLPARKVSIL
jgi:hypothetical protein